MFSLAGKGITVGILSVSILLLLAMFALYRQLLKKWLPLYFKMEDVQDEEQKRTKILVWFCWLLLTVILLMLTTGIDYQLYPFSQQPVIPSQQTQDISGTTPESTISTQQPSEITKVAENTIRRGIWISTVLFALLLFYVARLLDWVISHMLNRNFQKRREAVQKIALNFDQPR
ncbi:MAG: hypothetical protein KDD04_10745, partial [Sinomicrobium sp.]|nr:hypothetical protein [Sinomicrobium sp.]